MSYLKQCFISLVIVLLVSSVFANPVDLNIFQDSKESVRKVRSPKLHHLFGGGGHFGGGHFGGHHGGGHGGYGGQQGGYGGQHGGYGGQQGGYGGQQGGYGGQQGNNGGPHGGGGNFAGSAAFAGSNGHGSQGSLSQSQSASFAFGPFTAAFSQSQAGGRGGDPGFFDY